MEVKRIEVEYKQPSPQRNLALMFLNARVSVEGQEGKRQRDS